MDDTSAASPPDSLSTLLEQRRTRETELVAVDAPTVKLVIFTIGAQRLALPGAQVHEILPLTTIHFVPGCPAALEGVISVRGDMTSVIRLGDLLGLQHAPPSRHGAILLAQSTQMISGEPMRSGLRVDSVVDVLDILEDSLQAPPDTLAGPLRRATARLFQLGAASVALLDLDMLFQDYLHEVG